MESPKSAETRVLENIIGTKIEERLMDLAKIGGVIEKIGEKVTVNRLAFSEEDKKARDFLNQSMVVAGMTVEEFPFGLVGTYPASEGRSPQPAVMMMSHFDSVPNGGAYDGDVGVISAIEVVKAIKEQGLKFSRPIQVLALTGEESSRFQIALLGSKMAFEGLTEQELQSKRPGDLTLAEALTKWGVDLNSVTKPTLYPGGIAAVIELHIEQNDRLAEQNIDLGVVEAISAPIRKEFVIGNPLIPDTDQYQNARYLEISVAGHADHSGATPMGRENRADGLVPLADILITAGVLQDQQPEIKISIGGVHVEGQALNKIPGKTSCVVKIGGNPQDVETTIETLKDKIEKRNTFYEQGDSAFDEDPIKIDIMEAPDVDEIFYKPKDILPSHELAGQVIKAVNSVAQSFDKDNIVGTVGTYNVKGGQIILGVDIRGTNKGSVARVWDEVIEKLTRMNKERTPYLLGTLPKSADPAQMDPGLIEITQSVIKDNRIGTFEKTFSPAGQDSQVTAGRGIPTVMIFIPSRNGGVSHVPEEYSTPQDLEKGAKTLAGLVMRLASAA